MATATPLDTECPVCHEPFTVPKLLRCGHALCRHCLVSWLKTQPEANCPLCRHPIVDGQLSAGQTLDHVADSFPTHLFMAARVEAERLLSKQHACCVCVGVAAVSLCITCGDMFCQICSTVHQKQSVSKHHQLENLSTLTADALAAKHPARCGVHTSEQAQAYCPSHGVYVCLLCSSTKHRQCPRMVSLEDRVQEAQGVLSEVATQLKDGQRGVKRAIEEMDKDLEELSTQTDAGLTDLESVRLSISQAFQARCHELKDEVMTMSAGLKDKMVGEKAGLVNQQACFSTHSQIVQDAEHCSSHASFSEMMEMMRKRVDSLCCSEPLLGPHRASPKLTLTFDPQAVSSIMQALSQLGVVRVQFPVLRFHDNHGKKIRLSNDGQTAERTDRETYDGVVMSREPMIVSRVYEVHIDAINSTCKYTYVGVVTCSPDTFPLPSCALLSHSSSVLCVRDDAVRAFGKESEQKWPVLCEVPVGTKVGLALDSSRRLHLYVNRQDKGVITSPRIPDPCYFMFDLCSRCTKVTAQPVRAVDIV